MQRIDLAAINREEFNVTERDGRVLITPRKNKHVWTEEELGLRSVLANLDGDILSTGFQKFRNYGEDKGDDAAFRAALSKPTEEGWVRFTEKMDGSLIIVDLIDGEAHLRTRGNFDLGTFHEPVMRLIEEKYGMLLPWFATCADFYLQDCSLLFEYTGPENRIVIPYASSALTFLGAVHKPTMTLHVSGWIPMVIRAATGIAPAPKYDLPTDLNELCEFVKGWTDKEGIVAVFAHEGRVKLLKFKATQYVKLHAIKFKLSGKNVWKLAFLLGAKTRDEVREKFFAMGIDAEAQAFVQADIDAYCEEYARLIQRWVMFQNFWLLPFSFRVDHDIKNRRKVFVENVRATLQSDPYAASFFSASMAWLDGKHDEAWLAIVATEIFGESRTTLLNWQKNATLEVNSMLTVPDVED